MWLMNKPLPMAVKHFFSVLQVLEVYAGTEYPNWKALKTNNFCSLKGTRNVIIKKQLVVNFSLLFSLPYMAAKSSTLNHIQLSGNLGGILCYYEDSSGKNGQGLV